jgi:L-alanine-DL-glutamate epimerase-like enolase superfamily enzyme
MSLRRENDMQVTQVRPLLVDPGSGKNWLFVKVDIDAGISGWGECYTQADRDQTIAVHVQQLGRYPVSARSPDELAACKREIRPPVVTGEELYTKAEFRAIFEKRAADIINPDGRGRGHPVQCRK